MSPHKAEKSVKAWALMDEGKFLSFGGKWLIFSRKKYATEYDKEYKVVPCTITYTLPTKK